MLLTGNEDLRVQKTVTAIRQNFFEMFLKMNYRKITVTALCERAKINKKTFYRYYETMDFLLDEIIGEYVEKFLERIKDYRLPDELEKINREFFNYSVAQGKIYEKLISCPNYQSVSEKMIRDMVSRAWNDSEPFKQLDLSKKKFLLCYVHNVGLELYRQWISDGKSMPLEEIILLSNKLLCRGVFGFLEKSC